MILSIDPGSEFSGYVLMEKGTYRIIKKGKISNEEMLDIIKNEVYDELAIERVASYGMRVGQSVFDTVEWAGRFIQASNKPVTRIFRKDVKLNLCYTVAKVNDAVIKQALKDRFGEVGTKKEPGWFYGISNDMWSAYAVGVTFIDKKKEGIYGR